MTPATPLVDPEGYFVPSEAFSLRRVAGLVTGFWVATTALGVAQRLTGDVGGPPLSPLYPLQTLEATLLYWVVPAVLLYGSVTLPAPMSTRRTYSHLQRGGSWRFSRANS